MSITETLSPVAATANVPAHYTRPEGARTHTLSPIAWRLARVLAVYRPRDEEWFDVDHVVKCLGYSEGAWPTPRLRRRALSLMLEIISYHAAKSYPGSRGSRVSRWSYISGTSTNPPRFAIGEAVSS